MRVPWLLLCSDNRKYVKGYILSKQYRLAKDGIALLSQQAAANFGWACTDQPLSMNVQVWEPDHRRRDLNFSKALKDGITEGGAIWVDDRQVRDERWLFIDVPGKRAKAQAGAILTITRQGA